MDSSSLRPETYVAQALGFVDASTGEIVPQIHPSTTYARDADYRLMGGRLYSRADNPNYDLAEQVITRLEAGAEAALFASGNAAGAAVIQGLQPGARVLMPKIMYWALRGWVVQYAIPWGVQVEFVDMTDLEVVKSALLTSKTDMVWLETPANPTLTVTDIAAVSALAHEAGAKVVVDSTFASPIHTQPLTLGADFVMHSATKYLNGHSDVVAGVVVAKDKADPLWKKIRDGRFLAGNILGPFEAWLLLRGMRTLHVRVRQQSINAMTFAQHFAQHPKVREVLYPGLPDFTGHEIAARQMKGGFGGMLSVRVNGDASTALKVAGKLQLWKRATSLGGVESLVEHRYSVEGPQSPAPPDLLRLSTGIEAVEDLIADFEQALS